MKISVLQSTRYFLGFMLLAPMATMMGQQTPAVEERLREQASDIAAQVLPSFKLTPGSRVVIQISGHGALMLVENAFADKLRSAGFIPVLGEGSQEDANLQTQIMDQSVAASKLGDGKFLRTVRTVIECRRVLPNGELMNSGALERSAVDTVHEVSAGRIDDDRSSAGFLDGLVTPLIVVGSVVLMVYLLFTVRS